MAQQSAQLKEKLEKFLFTEGIINDAMTYAEQRTKVQRIYLAYGLIGLTGLWLVYGYGAPILANSIGFIYPAYCSIKALETDTKTDDKKWLTYWVVFSLFCVLEGILMYIIPLYWLLKSLFLIWCMVPGPMNGADLIYNKYIRPRYQKHQTQVDKIVGDAQNMVGGVLNSMKGEAAQLVSNHVHTD